MRQKKKKHVLILYIYILSKNIRCKLSSHILIWVQIPRERKEKEQTILCYPVMNITTRILWLMLKTIWDFHRVTFFYLIFFILRNDALQGIPKIPYIQSFYLSGRPLILYYQRQNAWEWNFLSKIFKIQSKRVFLDIFG
jgi:hypothetical protein